MNSTDMLVRRYLAVVADLGSPSVRLVSLLADDFVAVEHPNPVCPTGAERDRDATVAGFERGKTLLAAQGIEVHEVISAGDRAAVRASWWGTIREAAGPFEVGQRLSCEMAGFVTVREDRVIRHETYDCYPPFPTWNTS